MRIQYWKQGKKKLIRDQSKKKIQHIARTRKKLALRVSQKEICEHFKGVISNKGGQKTKRYLKKLLYKLNRKMIQNIDNIG